jgi:hypothetical protein
MGQAAENLVCMYPVNEPVQGRMVAQGMLSLGRGNQRDPFKVTERVVCHAAPKGFPIPLS